MAEDDPKWLKAGVATGSEFDGQGNAETDQSVCVVTNRDCPASNCGSC